MTTQAQEQAPQTINAFCNDLDAINAFCDELDEYLRTGILPIRVSTWKGVQTFRVSHPVMITTQCGDRKIAGVVVGTPQDFEHMLGQRHNLSLLL